MSKKKKYKGKRPKVRSAPADIRQLRFPTEFRIAAPSLPLDAPETVETEPQAAPVAHDAGQQPAPHDLPASDQLVAEFATCLWYLKTKHFRREWGDTGSSDDDPRVRRALSRLNKSIELLTESGIEVDDPINKRYPQGGEGMMRPIQFLPTAGVTFEVVSETVAPIIYREDRLIQRGEVFVAVPKEDTTGAAESTVTTAADHRLLRQVCLLMELQWRMTIVARTTALGRKLRLPPTANRRRTMKPPSAAPRSRRTRQQDPIPLRNRTGTWARRTVHRNRLTRAIEWA